MRSLLIALLAMLVAVPAEAQTFDAGFGNVAVDTLLVDIDDLPTFGPSLHGRLTPSKPGWYYWQWSDNVNGPWSNITACIDQDDNLCINVTNGLPAFCESECGLSFWQYPGEQWPGVAYIRFGFKIDVDGEPSGPILGPSAPIVLVVHN